MNNNHTIKPSTLAILGSKGEDKHQSYTAQYEPQQPESRWQRIKSTARKIGRFIKQVVSFVNNEILPILNAVGFLIKVCSNYNIKNMGCVPCAA